MKSKLISYLFPIIGFSITGVLLVLIVVFKEKPEPTPVEYYAYNVWMTETVENTLNDSVYHEVKFPDTGEVIHTIRGRGYQIELIQKNMIPYRRNSSITWYVVDSLGTYYFPDTYKIPFDLEWKLITTCKEKLLEINPNH